MKKTDSTLISSAANIAYLTNFTGFHDIEREAFIILGKNKKYLITDKRYSETLRRKVRDFEIIDCGAINFISSEGKEFFKKIKLLGFEENNLTVWEYNQLKKLVRLAPLDLSTLRVVKKTWEIKNIKKASRIADLAFEFILKKLKSGVSEKEIAEELMIFFKTKGSEYSFKPIVAFGKHASVPHHESSSAKLRPDQIVLLDFGAKVNNYCSDMTRTVFFGKATQKFKKIHKTVLDSQQKAIESIKSGMKTSKIDKIARDYIKTSDFPNIIHAVGHGIGTQVHEAPTLSPLSKETVKNGMVFSVEPGIYLPNYGGVRIEDLVLVRGGKAELISHARRGIIEIDVE